MRPAAPPRWRSGGEQRLPALPAGSGHSSPGNRRPSGPQGSLPALRSCPPARPARCRRRADGDDALPSAARSSSASPWEMRSVPTGKQQKRQRFRLSSLN